MSQTKIQSIAVIADYLPRQCGIATFTTDLCNALKSQLPGGQIGVIAMDDVPEGYDYSDTVRFQVRANVPADYLRAADFINVHQFDLAIVQHEYGIYGGKAGSYLIRLLKALNMPILTTCHTVLTEPNDDQRVIMEDLAKLSDQLVVMSHKAEQIFSDVYGLGSDKVAYIPHGIPDLPFSDTRFFKDQFKLTNRKMLLTFGLLGPGKGIEYMIDALPPIVEAHPDVVYVILGATHPHVLRQSGDAYRVGLQQRVQRLGVADNVQFHNRFVELPTLCQYLGAADVYVTPYPNEAQITSGTLAYAMGAGCAVVATPYWHASEMLADDRGKLVPFNDSKAMADAIVELLSDDALRHQTRSAAYLHTRPMIWKQVADDYIKTGKTAIDRLKVNPKPMGAAQRHGPLEQLPDIDLNHLITLTDDTGIIQHAIFATPNRFEGYCTDDNARALIAACMCYQITGDPRMEHLIQIYLSFLHHAFDPQHRRFRNFMSYDRDWLEKVGSDDSNARALWGLGAAVKFAPHASVRDLATKLFADVIDTVEHLQYPRSWAFALIGMHDYLSVFGGHSLVRRLRQQTAEKLLDAFEANSSDDWPWFENIVTYANAKVCQALLLAGQWIPNTQMFNHGLKALRWLVDQQTAAQGHVSIIGNDGWLPRDGQKARFDQQPIEAMCLVEACVEAFRATGDERWLRDARNGFDWFLGRNDVNATLVDFKTGGCCDGLNPQGANRNQGAESTLAWLISLLTMHLIIGEDTLVTQQAGRPKKNQAPAAADMAST